MAGRHPAGSTDTHAHVFEQRLPMAADRRYAPGYDAPVEDYLTMLDAQGVERGVLVQPSFLGTDNSYLLDALRRHGDRLRGVVVLDPQRLPTGGLAKLHAAGVRGARLNLVGRQTPHLDEAQWQHFGQALGKLGWHLEIQAEGEQWTALHPWVRSWPSAIVIDHLGRPRPDAREASRLVLELAGHEHVWVKVSAPYRSPAGAADSIAARLVAGNLVHRLVVGSDWPWTGHENCHDYGSLWRWAQALLGRTNFDRATTSNAARLLGWRAT